MLSTVFGLLQRAPHRRTEAGKIRLENIIGGAALQRLDRHFLADRAGDENER
ncbi:hypothetical protein D3C83_16280 [compost metagenome]